MTVRGGFFASFFFRAEGEGDGVAESLSTRVLDLPHFCTSCNFDKLRRGFHFQYYCKVNLVCCPHLTRSNEALRGDLRFCVCRGASTNSLLRTCF